jgi:hypothetical protein
VIRSVRRGEERPWWRRLLEWPQESGEAPFEEPPVDR